MLEPEITADRQTDLTEKAASGTLTLTLVSSLLAAGYLNAMTGLLCVTESLCALLLWSLFPGFIVLNAAPRPSQWGLGVKVKAFSHTHTHTHTYRLYKPPEPVLTQEMMCHPGQDMPDAQYVSAHVQN